MRKFVKSKCPAKGIWQYKLSLSYLKEHLKLYINFLYNYSVSCLVFELLAWSWLAWASLACLVFRILLGFGNFPSIWKTPDSKELLTIHDRL
jgi:hypothetical protein